MKMRTERGQHIERDQPDLLRFAEGRKDCRKVRSVLRHMLNKGLLGVRPAHRKDWIWKELSRSRSPSVASGGLKHGHQTQTATRSETRKGSQPEQFLVNYYVIQTCYLPLRRST